MVTYPKDWTVKSFDDFMKIKRGASPRPIENFLTLNVDGANWIKIGDAPRYGKYITSTAEKVTPLGAARSVPVFKGDFILSNSMSFGRPYILGINGCIHDGWLRLFDFQDDADDEFLYYLLSSSYVQGQYVAFAAGSGVQNLNKTVVKKVVVHLPPVPEQKAIASALSTFDTYIDSLTELIEKKRNIRDGALEDLVSGKLNLSGYRNEWIRTTLKRVASYRKDRGTSPKRHYISTENMNQNFCGIQPYSDSSVVCGCEFSSDNVLIANIRPYLKKIWYAEFDGCCSADVLVLAANEGVNPKLLYYILANDRYVNYVMAVGTKGIKMPRGDKKIIMEYELLIPTDYKEQEAIAAALTSMDKEITNLEAERDKMMQIREGAMDDLLTGRVRLNV